MHVWKCCLLLVCAKLVKVFVIVLVHVLVERLGHLVKLLIVFDILEDRARLIVRILLEAVQINLRLFILPYHGRDRPCA